MKVTVKRVCMDLWEGSASAVAAALPKAQVVVDRFHVAVHYREAVDTLRQAECRRLNAGRFPERAVPTAALRPLLRREWRSLNPDQQWQVVALFEQTPTLASAYVLRTLLTAIFDHTLDRATVQTRLQRWTEQVSAPGLSCFDQFLNALHHWQDGIFNYFDGRHTSGFVESTTNSSCSNAAASVWMIRSSCSVGYGWISRVHDFGYELHTPTSCGLHGRSY